MTLSNEQLTAIYNKANGITNKNPPISTKFIFNAMQAAYAAGLADGRKVPDATKTAVAMAYGILWHVNNEPFSPAPLYSPEKSAYEARKKLRELLTHKERGEAINNARHFLFDTAPEPKP